MEPSSRGISTGFRDARRWSNRLKPGSASSSGIDSRMACQGGDGLEGFDVEGRVRRWREDDDALPQSVEAEEEWDFSGADDGADALHGGLATEALERVGVPDAEDEVAPERVGKGKKKKRKAGRLGGREAGRLGGWGELGEDFRHRGYRSWAGGFGLWQSRKSVQGCRVLASFWPEAR